MPTEKQIASTFIRVGKRREPDDNPAAMEDRMRRPPGLIDTSHRRPGQIAHNFEPQRVGLIVDVVFERSSRTVFVLSFLVVKFSGHPANSIFKSAAFCLEAPAEAHGGFESMRDPIHAGEHGKVIIRRVVD
jgi:hypothetical protein